MSKPSLLTKIEMENELHSFFLVEFDFYSDVYPYHQELQDLMWHYNDKTKKSSLNELVGLKKEIQSPIKINYTSIYGNHKIFTDLDSIEVPLKLHLQIDHKLIPLYHDEEKLIELNERLHQTQAPKPSFLSFFAALILLAIEIAIYNSGGIAKTFMGLVLLPTVIWASVAAIRSLFRLSEYTTYKQTKRAKAKCKLDYEKNSIRIEQMANQLFNQESTDN